MSELNRDVFEQYEKEDEEMNDLDNLICLCKSCHEKLEGDMQSYNYEEFKQEAREKYE